MEEGFNYLLKLENIFILVEGYEIFKNLVIMNQAADWHINWGEGLILKYVSFLAGKISPKLRCIFSHAAVEFYVVNIVNIKIYEMIGSQSEIKIVKSNFNMMYSPDVDEADNSISLQLEKTNIILEDFKLMGDRDEPYILDSKFVFMTCRFDCKINMTHILVLNIFLNQVNKIIFFFNSIILYVIFLLKYVGFSD